MHFKISRNEHINTLNMIVGGYNGGSSDGDVGYIRQAGRLETTERAVQKSPCLKMG